MLQLGVELWAGGTAEAPEVRIARVVDPALGPRPVWRSATP